MASEPINDYDAMADAGIAVHPLADKFTCPSWDEPGRCVCGAELPPQKQWHNAGSAWQHVTCSSCGFGYVDEDDFIMFYEDGTDCADSNCHVPEVQP